MRNEAGEVIENGKAKKDWCAAYPYPYHYHYP